LAGDPGRGIFLSRCAGKPGRHGCRLVEKRVPRVCCFGFASPPTAGGLAIETKGLTKRFGCTTAVEDLSLAVRPGEVFRFLGPNGAGKSTTVRMLLGLIRPTAGTARVFSDDAADVRRAHRHLAYVPADVVLWPSLTGAEILELLARIGPGTDLGYRDELVGRFELDLDKPGRRTRRATGRRPPEHLRWCARRFSVAGAGS
jgi:ATPase subunit of ABC transporter with duplicated ATPase domains